jgi:hypothetical protein
MCVACVYLIQTKDVFEERLQNHHHYHPPPRRCLLATEPKMNSRFDSQHAQQKKNPTGRSSISKNNKKKLPLYNNLPLTLLPS